MRFEIFKDLKESTDLARLIISGREFYNLMLLTLKDLKRKLEE